MHSFIAQIFIDLPSPLQDTKDRVTKITIEKKNYIFKEFTFSVGRRHNKYNK